MIKGVGIDIVENARIFKIIKNNESGFLRKVFHETEILKYNDFKTDKQKLQFAASRWAVKEALVKAIGNKFINFTRVRVEAKEANQRILKLDEHEVKIKGNNEIIEEINKINLLIKNEKNEFLCSISHEENYSTAIVIHSYLP